MNLFNFVLFLTIAAGLAAKDAPKQTPVEEKVAVEGEETAWASETLRRSEHLYPSIWGQVGIFRVRSAYSLPEGALAFGIGGEFHSVGNGPNFGTGPSETTIAENLFVGYAPIENLTFAVVRRNSSTTFGQPAQLISSLGDFTFSGNYAFEITPSFTLGPVADLMIASNFNSISPTGSTVSAGVGALATFNFYSLTSLPLFAHANLIYNSPQISGPGPATLAPEIFFQFSRYNTITFGLGAEWHISDFIPFIEYYNTAEVGSPLSFFNSPSKISIGARFTPISNKGLSVLAGMDIGTGRMLAAGVPYTPPAQVIAQLSYTTGLTSTERKHYFTTKDVHVVNRKFIIKKQIHFKVGSAVLEGSSTHLLDQIAQVILKNKVHKLLIVGHTDSSAPEDYNLKLSLDRANTVKKYLVSKGVDEDALMTEGYGKRKPRASNATETGRAENRRVEFFILE